MYHVWNFLRRRVFSADLNFWIESVCLSSEGTEFHIVGAEKENERCPNVFVRSFGYIEFYCQKKSVDFIFVCTLGVDHTCKLETNLKRKNDR